MKDEQSSLSTFPTSSQGSLGDFWTFDAVEERLVEALLLWKRSPGGGRWPFAGDAPWQLMTRRTRIEAGDFRGREMQLRMQAEDAEETKRREGCDRFGPLSRDEVARRDEASEWLAHVSADSRKVVSAAIEQLAGGRENVDWTLVKRRIGAEIGNKGVYRRYTRAIGGIAKRLNAPAANGAG